MAALPPPGRVLKTTRLGWLTAALVAAGALCVVFPFFWMAVTSLKTVPEIQRLGLLDTYAGIVAPDLVSVFGVFLMRQSIGVVPSDYVDAARIDGAGELGIFWRVILPAVKPAIATLVIVKFMWTWNELFWPLVVVNSPTMKVVTLGLVSFTNMYFIEYNLVTAAAVVSVLPILAVFLAGQK